MTTLLAGLWTCAQPYAAAMSGRVQRRRLKRGVCVPNLRSFRKSYLLYGQSLPARWRNRSLELINTSGFCGTAIALAQRNPAPI
jgi:hypothetical protein